MAELKLGTCCGCGQARPTVLNVVALDKRIPEEHRGKHGSWGCYECGLPSEGAIAVLCDRCVKVKADIRFASIGDPADGVRIPIEDLTEEFTHDLARHPELRHTGMCGVCGCTDQDACRDKETGLPCFWVGPNLCSACLSGGVL